MAVFRPKIGLKFNCLTLLCCCRLLQAANLKMYWHELSPAAGHEAAVGQLAPVSRSAKSGSHWGKFRRTS
jgi:hypothetical protein